MESVDENTEIVNLLLFQVDSLVFSGIISTVSNSQNFPQMMQTKQTHTKKQKTRIRVIVKGNFGLICNI